MCALHLWGPTEMNLMQNYLIETPTQLSKIIEQSQVLFKDISKQKFTQIIMVGSGTSFHSGIQMAQIMRKQSGVSVVAYYPFQITAELLRKTNKSVLFIGISQGGSSLSTYDAMQLAKEAGCTVATMCGEKGAYLDSLADIALTVDIGEEKAGAKTKGYYATKLNLLLLAEYIGLENGTIDEAKFDKDFSNFEHCLSIYPEALKRANNWVKGHQEELSKAENIRIVGPASLYGDTLECALKLLETIQIHVTGYEFDEFVHGIYNAIDSKSVVFFIDNGTEKRIKKIQEVLGEWTDHLYTIDFSQGKSSKSFGYGIKVDPALKTFIAPLIFQVMAGAVPEVKGIDPTQPKDPYFHQKLQSKKFGYKVS